MYYELKNLLTLSTSHKHVMLDLGVEHLGASIRVDVYPGQPWCNIQVTLTIRVILLLMFSFTLGYESKYNE